MSIPLVLLGAGGHAKTLLDALLARGIRPIGILDNDPTLHGQRIMGVEVIGDDQAIPREPGQIFLVNGIGSTRSTAFRQAVFERFKTEGFEFSSVIHPASVISPFARLHEGVQVMAGAIVQPFAEVEPNVILNCKVSVDHDCWIGPSVHLAPGVTLSGDVRIGEGTHVGTGATIIQGINIGKRCLIGAGAVVVRDVPDGSIVMGVPARSRH